jgi:hypothetical protein
MRKDILMTHNVMLVNVELRVCKYQPATSAMMEEEQGNGAEIMYVLFVCAQSTSFINCSALHC